MTPLDAAHAAMEAAPGDDLARLGYYEAVAAAELAVMIEDDAGEMVRPLVFATEEGRFALAFEGEDRLAAFAEGPSPYAALPGRALVAQLAQAGLGLGVNLSEPSAFLMPAEAVAWLDRALSARPQMAEGRPVRLAAPQVPQPLLAALDRRLARMTGLAEAALLAQATWPDGQSGTLLTLVGPVPGAEEALAGAVSEALTFSGQEGERLDIAFAGAGDPLVERLAGVALRFDIPKPEARVPPGGEPGKPPRLR